MKDFFPVYCSVYYPRGVTWFGLRSVIVAFSDHTHLLFSAEKYQHRPLRTPPTNFWIDLLNLGVIL